MHSRLVCHGCGVSASQLVRQHTSLGLAARPSACLKRDLPCRQGRAISCGAAGAQARVRERTLRACSGWAICERDGHRVMLVCVMLDGLLLFFSRLCLRSVPPRCQLLLSAQLVLPGLTDELCGPQPACALCCSRAAAVELQRRRAALSDRRRHCERPAGKRSSPTACWDALHHALTPACAQGA